jgi:hypothetical protein
MRGLAPIVIAILALLAMLMIGCSTTVYKNGKPALRTYGDARNIQFKDGTTSFSADVLNHSKPTQTAFDGVGKTITAGGAAAAVGL